MAICPCDNLASDQCLDIPPALVTLPRQSRGFGEVKARLLASVAAKPSLQGWTAEADQDLGVMLLDMWSYVLDVTQFYDAKITDEFFLGTAKRDLSTHRIIKLLGYKPRPAMSAAATLAVQVDQADPLVVPEGAGFRSEAFEDEAPQIFQTLAPYILEPARNKWQFAPIDDDAYPGRVLLRPSENGVPKRGIVAFWLGDAAFHASQIEGLRRHVGPDDRQMTEVILETDLPAPAGTKLNQLKMRLMGLTAGPSPLAPSFDPNTLWLDTIYPQLRAGRLAVLEVEDLLLPFLIENVVRDDLVLPVATEIPITAMVSKVTIPNFDNFTLKEGMKWRLHFHGIRVGRLRAPFKTLIGKDDLSVDAELEMPRHQQDEILNGDFILHGAAGAGTSVSGQLVRDDVRKDITFSMTGDTSHFTQKLRTPVNLFGNLITAVRGEAVGNEVIGSGDAGSAVNRFKLKKAPLTWIEDESQASGRRPLLDVRVDGIMWDRVDTLYTSGQKDRVYLLELDAKGDTWVVFGDGTKGRRPNSGAGNIAASYRHGAGAAKPPIGTINQMARPIKGLGQVNNPLAVMGGADAEVASEIRSNAPATVLTLGRAVSVQDFTALARTYPGVLNVTSGWAWHPKRQRAVITIWVVENGGLDVVKLRDWLVGVAAEETPIEVVIADPDPTALAISVEVDDAFVPDDIRAEVLAVLTTGIVAVENVPIGGVIYRSAIVKTVQTVTGVASVPSVMLGGVEMFWAVKASAGTYLDFTDNVTVA